MLLIYEVYKKVFRFCSLKLQYILIFTFGNKTFFNAEST